MKRLFVVTLTVFFLLAMLFNLSVLAASNNYDLDELGLQVTIPTGYSVITRDTPANDPIFSKFGTTKSALMSQFESSSIYLNAVSDTYNEEVVVTMTENSLSNFSLLSDTTLNALASVLETEYTNYGLSVSKYEIYQHSQAKFVRLYFTDTSKTVHGLQYYTIYDGKAMNFTMRSYEGSVSSRQEAAIKTIVDSIKYDKAPPVAEQGEDTNSFIHTDTDSGVTFTVPSNWKQEEFSKDREFIDVKFVSTKEDGCTMIYGSTDMWEEMPASDKVGYTRSDINNSAFTKADIAAMYSTTADKISMVTYNGVQYFKGETNYTSSSAGVSVTMTQLLYIDNGWMYMFQFGGTSTHKLYSDFESVLKSVQYPTVPNVDGVGSTNDTTSNNTDNNSDDNSGIIAVVVLLIAVAVIVVVVVVSRKNNNEPANYTPTYNTPTPEPSSRPEPTIYCTKCGQALPLDSDFCHKCGTKVFKEYNTQ